MSTNTEVASQLRALQMRTEHGIFWYASDVARVAGMSKVAPLKNSDTMLGAGILRRYLRVLNQRGFLDDPALAQLVDGDILISAKAVTPLILLLDGEPGSRDTAAIEAFFASRDVDMPVIADVLDDDAELSEDEYLDEPEDSDELEESEDYSVAGDADMSAPVAELVVPAMHVYGSFDGEHDIEYADFDGQRWLRAGSLCAAYDIQPAGGITAWLSRRSEYEHQYTRSFTALKTPNEEGVRHLALLSFLNSEGADLALDRIAERKPDYADHIESTRELLIELWDEFDEVHEAEPEDGEHPATESGDHPSREDDEPDFAALDDPATFVADPVELIAPASAKPFTVPPAAKPFTVPPAVSLARQPETPPSAEADEDAQTVQEMRAELAELRQTVERLIDVEGEHYSKVVSRLTDTVFGKVGTRMAQYESKLDTALENPERRLASTVADQMQHERERIGTLLATVERTAIRRSVEAVVELLGGGVDAAEVERVLAEIGAASPADDTLDCSEARDAISILSTNSHERDVLVILSKSGPMHESELREALRSRGRRKLTETLFNLRTRGVVRRDSHNLWNIDFSSVDLTAHRAENLAAAN
ncbi:hypothetical protein ACT17_14700 [Mycolicibacterium conceptionense]|uniref:Uncharacterized protein n=1 Tax=Mycolicibacterium conceptionense TaxID=451644 RepID=A0A0J8WWZ2_9MYCO|nr:hypothetical protein [Mycolicibacterium conceptionense]KMV17544.1 hypothetical protein ACT17_14700 [Mycolicibacterium conceptionense]